MSAFIKLQRKGQMVIPRRLREQAGVGEGTLLKVDVLDGPRFLVTPQFTIDRPAVEGKGRNAVFHELAQIVAEVRQEAKEKGVDKMTKRQLNAAVSAARSGLKNKSTNRSMK